jgi:hypothetical protein
VNSFFEPTGLLWKCRAPRSEYTAFFVVGVSGPPGTVRASNPVGSSGTSAIASIAPGVNSSIAGRC